MMYFESVNNRRNWILLESNLSLNKSVKIFSSYCINLILLGKKIDNMCTLKKRIFNCKISLITTILLL